MTLRIEIVAQGVDRSGFNIWDGGTTPTNDEIARCILQLELVKIELLSLWNPEYRVENTEDKGGEE